MAQVIEGIRELVIEPRYLLSENDVRCRVLLVSEEREAEATDVQKQIRQLWRELFAPSVPVERQPGEYDSLSTEARVAAMIQEKSRRLARMEFSLRPFV